MPGSNGDAFKDFPESFRGTVHRPADASYPDARKTMITTPDIGAPALIARAADAEDVLTVARYAAETGTPLAVRAGGHGADGYASPQDALVLDLGSLKDIAVDPDTSVVRLSSGVVLGEMDTALEEYGLVVPAGTVSTTGVAGLTLGGGVGYNMRRYGATVDNLLSMDVVTTDGRLVRASETENPDLFWALRGGAGNFGIVTSFEFQARPMNREVASGLVLYPREQINDVLAGLREHMPKAPRELAGIGLVTQCPPLPGVPEEHYGTDILMMIVVYVGPLDKADAATTPLTALGRPILSQITRRRWSETNRMLDMIFTPGRRAHSKGGYLSELSDEAIEVAVRHAALLPDEVRPRANATQNIWALGGAISEDFDESSAAFSREGANWLCEAVAVWDDPADDQVLRDWVDALNTDMRPHMRDNTYINLTRDQGPEWRRKVWGSAEKYDRLVRAKNTWDPHNLLRFNKNIAPAGS
ncbi:FAD-binding oxidoreductase [Streptomyces sp. NBC_00075]|uniref:FAD-binding oxidoreductase n=1 Tax=Streptomyces sp. NBC_00075 TaxID=2975641 RepID=UPI003245EC80